MSENPVFHDKIAKDEHIANVLTKPLDRVKFEYFMEKLGVLQIKVAPKGK